MVAEAEHRGFGLARRRAAAGHEAALRGALARVQAIAGSRSGSARAAGFGAFVGAAAGGARRGAPCRPVLDRTAPNAPCAAWVGCPAGVSASRPVHRRGPPRRSAGRSASRSRRAILRIVRRDERDRGALEAGATRAPDAVDIILRMMRHVEIEDVADGRNIEAARRDVARHEEFGRALAEAVERAHARGLVHVAMQRGDREVRGAAASDAARPPSACGCRR